MNIEISVCCITYNHKDFISEMLEGILNQEFEYDYEIIIHDDASTDGTVDILKKYKEKYPDKIVLLLENENQYKNGKKMFYTDIQHAKGKYIAVCEGDDYWCDKYKLKKQYEFMEKNNKCMYLCHAAYMMTYGAEKMKELRTYQSNRELGLEEILEKGLIFPTASLFFRKESFVNIPQFYINAPIEDEPIKLLCLSQGKGFYMNEPMCVYRKNYPGSWNATVKGQKEKRLLHHNAKKIMYDQFNLYTNNKYSDSVSKAILLEDFNIVLTNQDYAKLREEKYKEILHQLSFSNKIRLFIASYIPKTYNYLIYLYKKL